MNIDTSCFADRVRGMDPFKGVPTDAVEGYLASVAILLRTGLFQPLVSGYEAIRFDLINQIVQVAHDATAMGLGRPALFRFRGGRFLEQPCHADTALEYITWRQAPAVDRLSFVEMLLRAGEAMAGRGPSPLWPRVAELLTSRGLKLVVREGRFEPSDGPMVEREVHDPFWDLVAGSSYENVRKDITLALQVRDAGGPNPAFYAARALESALKIISGNRGVLTGKERGAANVIDTLVSARNGRFIDPWEAEMMKRFFAEVRNPDAHGAGADPQPQLIPAQANWAIEFCMITIKSLLSRS